MDELLEHVRQHLRRDARAVIGDAERRRLARDLGIDDDVRLRRRVRNGIGDDVAERLLDELGIGPDQRQLGGQSTSIVCAAPRRRAALATRSTTSRRSIQSRRTSSAPASMRVMASRLRTISSSPSASSLI